MPCLKLHSSDKGLSLRVALGASFAQADATFGEGNPPPLPVEAIIDTGASITCVDSEVVQILRLKPIGEALVRTLGGEAAPRRFKTFAVSLRFESAEGVRKIFPAAQVVSASFYQTGIQALIGRDILNRAILQSSGFSGLATLAFSQEAHDAFYANDRRSPLHDT